VFGVPATMRKRQSIDEADSSFLGWILVIKVRVPCSQLLIIVILFRGVQNSVMERVVLLIRMN